MRIPTFCLFFFLSITVVAQDAYHQSLLDQLESDFAITGGEWLLAPDENQILTEGWSYGEDPFEIGNATDQPFSQKVALTVNFDYDHDWQTAWGISNLTKVEAGDHLLIIYWARLTTEGSGRISSFFENNETYEKEYFETIPLSKEWRQYFIPIQSRNTYEIDAAQFGFHLGNQRQSIEFAGMNIINYQDKYQLTELPEKINNDIYGGFQPDASWRAEAEARIDQLRKASISITLKNSNGVIMSNAGVGIEMMQHEYPFGTAISSCAFAENNCQNDTYEAKLLDLDGRGHGFNWVSFEDGLTWPYWEGGWPNSQFEKAKAIKWLRDRDIKVRGMNLYPAFWGTPQDIQLNIGDINYVENRMNAHIDEKFNHPAIHGIVEEWDLLSNITWARDLENSFIGNPGYETGREIYAHLFEQVKMQDDFPKLFLNDYITISNRNSKGETYDRFQSYIQELIDVEAPIDGIGFQAHMDRYPTSIYQLEEILNDFSDKYNLMHKITEFDLDSNTGSEIEAAYLRDFMTYVFSHPSTTGILLGGFWDGEHWKDHAPIFNDDWSLKPSGQAFIDLVFKKWWTETFQLSDNNGKVELDAFKGKYIIQINCDEIIRDTVSLSADGLVLEYPCEQLVSVSDLSSTSIKIIPNPSAAGNSNSIIERTSASPAVLTIINSQGQLVRRKEVTGKNISLTTPQNSGMYFIEIQDANGISRLPWIVK